jgi:hypothetical protein
MRRSLLVLVLVAVLAAASSAAPGLISIGSKKQLFVDDFLIESLTNTKRVLNAAEKAEGNPVIRPDRPWEGNDVRVSHLVYEPKEQQLKMWYSTTTYRARRGAKEIEVVGEGGGAVCLATSKDGIVWEKPNLGLVEFRGSKANNILPKSSRMEYMFRDQHESDPSRRYKGLMRIGTTETPGMTFDLYFSPDGFTWTPYEKNPVINTAPKVGRWGPTAFMGWDPIRRVYAVHMENCLHRRCPLGKRMIGRAESPDMIHWSEPETIILPDERDTPDTEFYDMPVSTYEGLYVGLLWNFRTTNTTMHPQAVFSRDGIHYNREFREPFVVRGPRGEFDSAVIYVNEPLVHQGRILTYYTGVNWRSPESLLALGDKALGAIGLAITPLDGFVSLDGARLTWSEAVTRSFTFTGSRLELNVRSALQQWGAGPCEVRAELLEANHALIPGYTFKDADPITTSGEAHVASWQGKSDVAALSGRPIKLRLYFKNAKIFSFRFR